MLSEPLPPRSWSKNALRYAGLKLAEAKFVLCHFACSCQEFPVAELTSFSETSRERAFERFELLRIHFEGGRPLSTIARKPSFAAESDYSP